MGKFSVICGGTLVSPDTIVSAAHCFDQVAGLPSPDIVRLGEHNILSDVDDGAKHLLDVKIRSITQHPGWNSLTLENDIAVVKLEDNVTYNEDVSPACLPDLH